MNILVLDIGTSSIRALLFDENGNCKGKVQNRYCPTYISDSMVEQQPGELSLVLRQVVREISQRAKHQGLALEGISISSQRSSITALDRDGIPLLPFIMWQDKRTGSLCDKLKEYDSVILERSGAGVNSVFSGVKMSWIRENCPEIYSRTYKFVNIFEYILFTMTGIFGTDTTYASRSNLMNIRNFVWDKDLMELFRIEEEKLCDIFTPGQVIGFVNEEFAKDTEIEAGIPVISAGGDQQCSALGQNICEEGDIAIINGTGAFLLAAFPQLPPYMGAHIVCNASAIPGEYILEANALTCAAAFDWFCNIFYEGSSFEKLEEELAKEYENVSSCLVLPYFQGRGTPDWNNRASACFENITLHTLKREMLKSLIEGIFLENKNNLDFFLQNFAIRQIKISGGMTKMDVMNQIQADIYGRAVYKSETEESGALGALINALPALGVYKTARESSKAVTSHQRVKKYYPNGDLHFRYQWKQKKMQKLYRALMQREQI